MKSDKSLIINEKSGGVREMLAIALPMIASNTCDTVMLFTDRLFLSKLGPEYMSASMGGGLTSFMVMSLFFGLIGYSTAVTAQYFGSGEMKKCPSVTFQAVLIALVAYPLIMFLLVPVGHMLFNLSGIDQAQLKQQKPYFDILMAGCIFWLIKFAFSSFFSGIGRTKVILVSSVVSMFANVFLSWTMIFGKFGFPALGISGAAYSTVFSTLIGLVILVINYLLYLRTMRLSLRRSIRYDREILLRIVRFGFPAGMELFLTMSAFTAMIFMFQSIDLNTSTAVTIVFNWDHVAYVPLMGLEVGVTSLFGRYVGAQRHDIAMKTVRSGLKAGMLYSLCVALIFLFLAVPMTDVFRPSAYTESFSGIFSMSVFMIRTAAMYVAVEALIVVYAGALRGAGDTFWAMLINVSMTWLLTSVMYVILHVLHMPLRAAWIAMVLIFTIVPELMYLRFRTGKWKTVNLTGKTIS